MQNITKLMGERKSETKQENVTESNDMNKTEDKIDIM